MNVHVVFCLIEATTEDLSCLQLHCHCVTLCIMQHLDGDADMLGHWLLQRQLWRPKRFARQLALALRARRRQASGIRRCTGDSDPLTAIFFLALETSRANKKLWKSSGAL